MKTILKEIMEAYKKRVLFTVHALNQMNMLERMISKNEVYEVIEKGELIEHYPDDPRGHSCLVGRKTKKNRWVHVLCAPKDEYLAVITTYLPDPDEWEEDMKRRRKKK